MVNNDTATDLESIKFKAWDFAGQTERYHATHELYFEPGSLYIVIWDIGACEQSSYFESERLIDPTKDANNNNIESSGDDSSDDDTPAFMRQAPTPRLNAQNSDENTANKMLEINIDENVQVGEWAAERASEASEQATRSDALHFTISLARERKYIC